MITLHDAIYALNNSIVSIRENIAYDANENVVEYDKSAAETKLAQLQAAQTAKQQSEVAAKTSALSKLSALGLTEAEIKALTGN
jgi:hypothetical protein